MKTFDQNVQLTVQRAGRITIIGRQGIGEIEKLDGTFVILVGDEDIASDLADWLQTQEIDHAATALGVSRAVVGRIRQALGLAKTYDGSSRTTSWRRRQEPPIIT